ncbi:hypothetical protein N7335_01945 [Stutzerimonas stutzeri]|uniref:Holin n=1 Tax=Stutzerimonas stutzeri TaxID=316 RepID=A0AA42H3S7_STUST|nr:hypothetical protein [Stutzerimonas stutzeri]MDH0145148.1 hypothetical protein [Stutzerimonas stutzeri]MDH0149597.1 hypothetical protein [Stutzerimonas stutzeri]
MSSSQNLHDITTEVAKFAPPVTVTTAVIAGISVADWAAIITIIWVSLNIGDWFWKKFFKKSKVNQEKDDNSGDGNDA